MTLSTLLQKYWQMENLPSHSAGSTEKKEVIRSRDLELDSLTEPNRKKIN